MRACFDANGTSIPGLRTVLWSKLLQSGLGVERLQHLTYDTSTAVPQPLPSGLSLHDGLSRTIHLHSTRGQGFVPIASSALLSRMTSNHSSVVAFRYPAYVAFFVEPKGATASKSAQLHSRGVPCG
mmetsp:Transcript_161/g.551  ORF Transcript_161/g.551 Transcript_161/m.551 type:complete len:126 (+) Transcript_161:1792-2169(+)